MKKTVPEGAPHRRAFRQMFLLMKMLCAALFACCLHVSAKGYSQTKVTLQLQNVHLARVFQEIEQKTDFRFLFDDRLVGDKERVSVNVKNEQVTKVLNNLLPDAGLRYTVTADNLIIISTAADGKPARDPVVRGRVLTAEGLPLANVTVTEKGTKNVVTTTAAGDFEINVSSTTTVLVFTSVGYKAQEVSLAGRTSVSITLDENPGNLNEVVVVGYGSRRRTDLTSSVASVGAEEISKSVASTPQLALQGRAPGVFVQANSGSPTARPTVRIRGLSTFLNAEPLYVVDGVPIFEYGSGDGSGPGSAVYFFRGPVNFFATLNPDDIESISVLKDGASAAIYGNRAANGVVLITTKRGKAGKPRIDFTANTGVNAMNKKYDVLTGPELKALIDEATAANPSIPVPVVDQDILTKYANAPFVDWQEAVTNRSAVFNNISLRLSGGNDATTYNLGVGYHRNQGNLLRNQIERYSLTMNLTSRVSRFMEVGINNRFAYVDAVDMINDGGQAFNLSQVFSNSPWQPIYDPAGFGGFAASVSNGGRLYGNNTRTNGVAQFAFNDQRSDAWRNIINGYVQVEPLKNLKLKASAAADVNRLLNKGWYDVSSYLYFNNTPDATLTGDGTSLGKYEEKRVDNNNILFEYSASYAKLFGRHSVEAFAGYSDQLNRFTIAAQRNSQNASREPSKRTLAGPRDFIIVDYGREVLALLSYIGRVSYNFDRKYFLDLTYRRDGSSNFAPENRWGNFGGVSAAWRVSSEKFMTGQSLFNDLKLRAGYGVLGSQASVSSGAYLATINSLGNTSFGSGAGNATGVAYQPFFPAGIASRNITWETNKSLSVGIDAQLLKSTLNLTVEYYNRFTDGILQAVQLPMSAGALYNPNANVAQVRNSGMEFSVGYQNTVGQVNYFANANLTTVKNRVEKLNEGTAIHNGGVNLEEGQPINYIWGPRAIGIIRTDKELDDYRRIDDKNVDPANRGKLSKGDVMYADINGDGIIDIKDNTYLGKFIPGYYYGFSFGADYKGIDLSVFFQGVGDVNAINPVRVTGENVSNGLDNRLRTVLDRYSASNPDGTVPRAIAGDPLGNNRFSSRFVESGAFLRLKNVQLGYSLPAATMRRLGFVTGVRVFASGSNLLTFTDYSGLDPEEQAANSGLATVIPVPKTFTFGLSLNF